MTGVDKQTQTLRKKVQTHMQLNAKKEIKNQIEFGNFGTD